MSQTRTGTDADGRTTSMVDRLVRWAPIAFVLSAVAIAVRRAADPLDDPDAWWHLRLGEDLWQQGSLRTPPDWSPRATVDWVPSEPLPEVLAARMEHWWGLPSLAWLFGLSTVLVVASLWAVCRREAPGLAAAVTTFLAFVAMLASITPRPQLVSFVLLAAVPVAWDRAGRTLRAPWWLVPLTWFWSMCHGFWLLGLGLSGLCWLGLVLDRRPDLAVAARLALVPVASAAVVLLNPSGWQVVLAPLSVNDTTQYISEWERTSVRETTGIICAVLLLAMATLMVVRRRHVRWSEVLLLLAAVFFCWYAVRTIAVAAVIAAPLLARHLGALTPQGIGAPSWRTEGKVLTVGAAAALLLLAVVVPRTADEPEGVPSALSDELDRLPDGAAVLNRYSWGGWLAWRHPDLDRTADGLVVPYDPDYIGDLVRIERAAEGWQSLVDGVAADYALFEGAAEVTHGLRDLGWRVVAEADGAALLARPGVDVPTGRALR